METERDFNSSRRLMPQMSENQNSSPAVRKEKSSNRNKKAEKIHQTDRP